MDLRAPKVVRPSQVSEVVAALAEGEVVAIPTDTVYGLAACLDMPEALEALFWLKDRPVDFALPVLIGRKRQVPMLAPDWPASSELLSDRFWPGPLTLVVRAEPSIGRLVGGDGLSVGIRLPDHELVRELCSRLGPLAVTSANRHGDPPCTTADQVVSSFEARDQAREGRGGAHHRSHEPPGLALVVDGGLCSGEPSTVVDCMGDEPRCLRAGAISWEMLGEALRRA